MYKIIVIFLLILALPMSDIIGQAAHSMLRLGDKAYEEANYATAEEDYRKAAKDKSTFKSDYNLANTLYKQERFEEASQYYQSAISMMKEGNTKSQAYHNLGNSLFQEKKLKESVQAYKEALRISPKDMETKYNLQKTKQLIKMQQQQQQQQDQKQDQDQDNQDKQDQDKQDQDQDQDKKDEKQQDKDKKDQDKKDQDKKDDDKKDEKQDQDQKNQDKQSPEDQDGSSKTGEEDKQTLDKEDALKLLQVIENEEKKVQEKLRRINSNTKKPEKDW